MVLIMKTLAILLIGYSFFYAIILTLTHFRCDNYKGQAVARLMAVVLLIALVGLQMGHYFYLLHGSLFIHSHYYALLLFSVAPAFYLFSKPLLKADETDSYQLLHLLHGLPLVISLFLPYALALPFAFMIGMGYLIWLAKSIYALREQRQRFHIELIILAIVFVIAIAVLILGLSLPIISEQLFFILYACAIGIAFLLITIALSYAPDISNEVIEAAQETYATSTLKQIDCEASLEKLHQLMREKKLYQENNLDLRTLAIELELSGHQLSELMNTQLGKSFSRYIREQRIEAAKQRLSANNDVSVLAVGLSVGFASQSNFYAAFREIVGTTPGKFRKLALQHENIALVKKQPLYN